MDLTLWRILGDQPGAVATGAESDIYDCLVVVGDHDPDDLDGL